MRVELGDDNGDGGWQSGKSMDNNLAMEKYVERKHTIKLIP